MSSNTQYPRKVSTYGNSSSRPYYNQTVPQQTNDPQNYASTTQTHVPQHTTDYRKSVPCKHFSKTGLCPYDNSCAFLHKYNAPCKYFSNDGFCKLGDSCLYLHDPKFVKPQPEKPSIYAPDGTPKRQIPCIHEARGGCRLGINCLYSHNIELINALRASGRHLLPSTAPDRDRNLQICKYFNSKDGCIFGDACDFDHYTKVVSPQQTTSNPIDENCEFSENCEFGETVEETAPINYYGTDYTDEFDDTDETL